MSRKKQEKVKNTLKVIIVALMAIGVALSALAPVFAQEEQLSQKEKEREDIEEGMEEVRDKIESITSDIASLSLYETRTVKAQGIPSDFSFRYRQEQGAQGEAVRYLQKVLNLDPSTRVAQSGPGSLGNETTMFGPATMNALMRFQNKHSLEILRPAGITRANGFMGELTRAKLNKILKNGVTIKESVKEERMQRIQTEFMEVRRMVDSLREKVRNFYEENGEDKEKKSLEDCKQDIEDAKEYAQEMSACTMEVRTMSCEGVIEYTAPNGCEIGFLLNKGWE